MSLDPKSTTVFACDMQAITAADRPKHVAIIAELFGLVVEVQELEDGYAFKFPDERIVIQKIAEFITNERLCCPFLGFSLHVLPNHGEISLYVTGPIGIKPFILAEIGHSLKPSVIPPPSKLA